MLSGLATRVGARPPAATEARPIPSSSGRWGFPHVPALDGLRGAAVAAVLLYHAGYLDGGYLGVDLFFVLSGYLITSLLLVEKAATGRVNLPGFWARRIRRLLPALLLVLAGVAVYAVVVARPIDLPGIRRDGLATLFYVANWSTILRGTSYWDISLAPSPLQHTWSLAIEEQFYLLWPIVVVGVMRLASGAGATRLLRNLCVALAVVSAALFAALPLAGASTTRAYEGTDSRAFALLLGAGWAAQRVLRVGRQDTLGPEAGKAGRAGEPGEAREPGKAGQAREPGKAGGVGLGRVLPARVVEGVGIVAAGLLAVAWFRLDGRSDLLYRGGLPLTSLVAVVVVVAVTVPGPSPVLGRGLSWAPLRWLGLISYGLYLWHWPVYQVLTPTRVGADGLRLLFLRLAVSVTIAALSFTLVEMPIRRGALRGRGAHLAIPAATAAAAMVLVVGTLGAVDPQSELVAAQADVQPTGPGTTIAGAPTLTFVGDSLGLSVAQQVTADPAAFGVNPVNRTWIACSPMVEGQELQLEGGAPVLLPLGCRDEVVPKVGQESPDVVVVLFGAGVFFEMRIDGAWTRPCDPAFDREYGRVFEQYARDVGADGAQVVLGTIPIQDIRTNVSADAGKNESIGCQNAALADAAEQAPNTHLLDLNELVCPRGAGRCPLDVDGEPFRTDGLHFDVGGGGLVVTRWIVEQSLALTGLEPP